MSDRAISVLRVSAGLDPRIGGPYESTVLSVLAAVNAAVSTALVAPIRGAAPEESVQVLRDAAVPVILFPLRSRRWSFSPSLGWWLLRNVSRYDVIHAHGAWTFPTLAAAIVAKASRRPIVLTPHESLTQHDVATSGLLTKRAKVALRRLYLSTVDVIVFASAIEAGDVPIYGKAQRVVVPHPVAPRVIGSRAEPTKELRVGYLGRLDPKKNVGLLIRSLPDGATLVIAGAGPLEQSLRREASMSRANVVWWGFLTAEQREGFFASIDVLALPSKYECFGMAAAEALAAGVPVLVSAETGIAELVRRHDCGLVVAPTESAIRAALTNPAAWWGDRASRAETAIAEFAPARHGGALRALYEDILQQREQPKI